MNIRTTLFALSLGLASTMAMAATQATPATPATPAAPASAAAKAKPVASLTKHCKKGYSLTKGKCAKAKAVG